MYISTNPSDIEATATNLPQGLTARADRAELCETFCTKRKLEVSQRCKNEGNLADKGLTMVNSRGR